MPNGPPKPDVSSFYNLKSLMNVENADDLNQLNGDIFHKTMVLDLNNDESEKGKNAKIK